MVNDEFMKEWELISKQLEAISLHQLPRYVSIREESDLIKYQLVCFCDASGMAQSINTNPLKGLKRKQKVK